MSFLNELKRRNVIRVATAYVVASWLIIQVVETIFPVYGLGDTAIRTVITLLAVGFIPTLIFSWVFEITPEGLKREVEIIREESTTRLAGRKLDRVIMLLLAVAIGYFAFDKFVLEPVRIEGIVEEAAQQARTDALVESYGDQSIAVLPFVNMSADQEQEYFSDGISEEILNLLARIPELRVISRSSAFSFKGKDVAMPEVARQLNVGHVLEGSVRKAGDRVRITVQLIEARSDTHLWAETFDRELGDIFEVQEEIAQAIGHELRLKLVNAGDQGRLPNAVATPSTTAYDAYLKGRELIHLRGSENLEQAVDLLTGALLLDDGFAPAHAQLAIAQTLLAFHEVFNVDKTTRIVVPHLERAEELEPDLADIYVGRGLLAGLLGDSESEVTYAQRALALNPNQSDAMNGLQISLHNLGRYQEADEAMQQMLLRDPLTIVGRFNYTEWLSERGHIGEAHELADQLLAQSPKMSFKAHANTSLIWEGRMAEGLQWALMDGPGIDTSILTFFWLGMYEEAHRLRPQLSHWIDAAKGHYDTAVRSAQDWLEHAPRNEVAVWTTAEMLYTAGRISEALPLYEQMRDFVPENRPIRSPMTIYRSSNETMMRLAQGRRIAGDESGAQAAVQVVRQDHAARQAVGIDDQFQKRTEAIIFEELRSQPGFIAVKENLAEILDRERQKVVQLICFQNPVPDRWQPMAETCHGLKRAPEFE
jgi:TolB-like protein